MDLKMEAKIGEGLQAITKGTTNSKAMLKDTMEDQQVDKIRVDHTKEIQILGNKKKE